MIRLTGSANNLIPGLGSLAFQSSRLTMITGLSYFITTRMARMFDVAMINSISRMIPQHHGRVRTKNAFSANSLLLSFKTKAAFPLSAMIRVISWSTQVKTAPNWAKLSLWDWNKLGRFARWCGCRCSLRALFAALDSTGHQTLEHLIGAMVNFADRIEESATVRKNSVESLESSLSSDRWFPEPRSFR